MFPADAKRRRFRIGLVAMESPDDPQAISGMPHAIKGQLRRLGHEVTDLVPDGTLPRRERLRRRVAPLLPSGLRRAVKRSLLGEGGPVETLSNWLSPWLPSTREAPDDEAVFQRELARARAFSRDIQAQVEAARLDALVGVCMSIPLYALEVDLPVVYFSDTTASIILRTYPRWRDQPAGWHRACQELERVALSRATRAVFATDLACRSAVDDFGVDRARVRRIPLGANVLPDAALLERARATPPPSRDDVRLVITAADPVRKRVDLAIDAVEVLRARGVRATLTFIGPPTPRAQGHPHVRCAGRLVLSTADDRRRNLELLADSHLMVLPSLGEAFGIAVAEAAHLAKPSVVSDAGGLPEVLEHGRSALVLPVAAGADAWADAVSELALHPARYVAFSAAALERARAILHWNHFGERLHEIVEEVVP